MSLWTFHDLLDADPPAERRPEPPPDRERQSDYYEWSLPEVYLDLARETGRQSQSDCLVADEGQDLLRPAYVDCLDQMVRGGLRGGRWRICYDPGQSIYNRDSSEMVERPRLKLFKPEVKVQLYKTGPEELELVWRTIDELRQGGVKPREIVLLGGTPCAPTACRGTPSGMHLLRIVI